MAGTFSAVKIAILLVWESQLLHFAALGGKMQQLRWACRRCIGYRPRSACRNIHTAFGGFSRQKLCESLAVSIFHKNSLWIGLKI
jgi:hypothetical protein